MNIFLIHFLILLFGLRQSADGIPINEFITEDTNAEYDSPITPLLVLNTMEGILGKLLFSNEDPSTAFENQMHLLNRTIENPETEIGPEMTTTTKAISESTSQAVKTEDVIEPSINQNNETNSKLSNQSATSAIEPNTTVDPKTEKPSMTEKETSEKPNDLTNFESNQSDKISTEIAKPSTESPAPSTSSISDSKISTETPKSEITTSMASSSINGSKILTETPKSEITTSMASSSINDSKISTETPKSEITTSMASSSINDSKISTETPKSEITTSNATTIEPETSSLPASSEKPNLQNPKPLINFEPNQSNDSATNKFESLDTFNSTDKLSTEIIELQNKPADNQKAVSGDVTTPESSAKSESPNNLEFKQSNADEFSTQTDGTRNRIAEQISTPEPSAFSLSTLAELKNIEKTELLNKFESTDQSIEALIDNTENVNESPTSISVADKLSETASVEQASEISESFTEPNMKSTTPTQFESTVKALDFENQASTENNKMPTILSATDYAIPHNSNENNPQPTEATKNPNIEINTEVPNLNNNDYISDDAVGLTTISKGFVEDPVKVDITTTNNIDMEPEGSGLGEIENNDLGPFNSILTIENLTAHSETNMAIPNNSSTTAGVSVSELHENGTNNLDKHNTTPMVVTIQKEISTVQATGATTASTANTASTAAITTFKPIPTMLTSVSTTTPLPIDEHFSGDKSREVKLPTENAAPSPQTASILLIAISFFYSRILM